MVTQADCVKRMQDEGAVRAALMALCGAMNRANVITISRSGNGNGVRWWAHGGTALSCWQGIGKEGSGVVLPGDNDLDIGVAAETIHPAELAAAMADAGWRRGYFFEDTARPGSGVVLRFFFDGVPVDVYWHYRIPAAHDGYSPLRWWLTAPRIFHQLPDRLFSGKLDWLHMLGVALPVPHMPAYLFQKWHGVYVDGEWTFPGRSQGGERLCGSPAGWEPPVPQCCDGQPSVKRI